jgi:hypothetical protein
MNRRAAAIVERAGRGSTRSSNRRRGSRVVARPGTGTTIAFRTGVRKGDAPVDRSALHSMPPLVVLGLLAGMLSTATFAAEISVQGTWLTGDRSDGETYSSETFSVRIGTGGRVRLRAYLPYIRMDEGASVVWTVTGPKPLPPGQRPTGQGAGNDDPGTGAGPGSSTGNSGEDPGSGEGGRSTQPATSTVTNAELISGGTVSGLGDARVGLTARLLGGGSGLHALSAEFDVKAPTADEDEGLGSGEWDFRLGLAAEHRGWHGTIFGGVGYTEYGDPAWATLADGIDAYLGFEAEPWLTRLVWSVWVDAAEATVEGTAAPVLAGVGLRRDSRRPWQVSAWTGLDQDSPTIGITFGWSPGETSWRAAPWGARR